MEILFYIFLLIGSYFLGTVVDFVWFHKVDYKSAEKGMEVLEHGHVGIILMATGFLSWIFIEPWMGVIQLGLGISFLNLETRQPHPWAIKSDHFNKTLVITTVLTAITVGIVSLGLILL